MTGENEKPVSPLPWRLEPGESKVPEIESAKGDRVTGLCNSAGDYDVSPGDRDYIVTACNAYPDLKARIVALETENARLREALEGAKADIRWTLSKRVDGLLHPAELQEFAKVAECIESALQGDRNVQGT